MLKLSQKIVILTTLVGLSACSDDKLKLANPASGFCVEKGGTVKIMTKPEGGQYGVCLFEDNKQCEEWALMRGDCPVGGVRITGYNTPEGVYCAITGGRPKDDEKKCMTKSGELCDAVAYYNGECK